MAVRGDAADGGGGGEERKKISQSLEEVASAVVGPVEQSVRFEDIGATLSGSKEIQQTTISHCGVLLFRIRNRGSIKSTLSVSRCVSMKRAPNIRAFLLASLK